MELPCLSGFPHTLSGGPEEHGRQGHATSACELDTNEASPGVPGSREQSTICLVHLHFLLESMLRPMYTGHSWPMSFPDYASSDVSVYFFKGYPKYLFLEGEKEK